MGTKKKKRYKNLPKKNPIVLALPIIVICLLTTIGVLLYIKHINQNKYKFETPKNEVHKLPKEAMRQIKAATTSAIVRVPILMYHYVEYVRDKRDTIRQSLDITPFIFEKQITTLQDAGYTFMTAKELADVLDGKKELPEKPVLLTFDDGHWDLDTDVLPILKKYNVKATAYIVPGFLNQSDFLSTTQLQDVVSSGLVEIGAHTVHHMWLKGRLLTTVQKEVNDSKTMLEETLHIPVVSFAYPYGAFDQQAEDVVKTAKFTNAVSTAPGIMQSTTNRYFLFRLRPGGRTGKTLLSFLEQKTFTQW